MSLQWNMNKSDQRSDKPLLEQLWYTWSVVAVGPVSPGLRIGGDS